MGMYDYVRCHYPLPNPRHNVTAAAWQSKSTPNQMLDVYTITADGRLLCDGAAEVTPPFDGDIYFYSFGNEDELTYDTYDGWIEYRATFRSGRVVEMTRIRDRYTEASA